jgi:hypothetical protein
MDVYLLCMIFGFGGLLTLAVGGMGHGHGHGSHGHGGHGGHAGHGGALGHGHGHVGDVNFHGHAGHGVGAPAAHGALASGHGHAAGAQGGHAAHGGHPHGGAVQVRDASWDLSRAGSSMMALLSPRSVSSLLLGGGATGMIVGGFLGGGFRLAAAVAGGALVEVGVVRPLWGFLQGFASPARTLESAVMDEARAASGFDAHGQGLVAVEVDGQVCQVLGTLRPADVQAGVKVRAGDRLLIEDVDAERNRCTVSLLG